MRPEDRARKALADIRDSAAFILAVTEGKSPGEYSRDRLLRQAVERNLEIIGEAVGRLSRYHPSAAGRIHERARIIAFRNVLIHGYDLVDDELVWDTARNKLPMLLSQIDELLQQG
jgi:uncharacterized protein with HEPN domain